MFRKIYVGRIEEEGRITLPVELRYKFRKNNGKLLICYVQKRLRDREGKNVDITRTGLALFPYKAFFDKEVRENSITTRYNRLVKMDSRGRVKIPDSFLAAGDFDIGINVEGKKEFTIPYEYYGAERWRDIAKLTDLRNKYRVVDEVYIFDKENKIEIWGKKTAKEITNEEYIYLLQEVAKDKYVSVLVDRFYPFARGEIHRFTKDFKDTLVGILGRDYQKGKMIKASSKKRIFITENLKRCYLSFSFWKIKDVLKEKWDVPTNIGITNPFAFKSHHADVAILNILGISKNILRVRIEFLRLDEFFNLSTKYKVEEKVYCEFKRESNGLFLLRKKEFKLKRVGGREEFSLPAEIAFGYFYHTYYYPRNED